MMMMMGNMCHVTVLVKNVSHLLHLLWTEFEGEAHCPNYISIAFYQMMWKK